MDVRIGGWVWFLAGIIFGELLRNGLALAILQGLIGAMGQIAVFVGAVGTLGLVVIATLAVWWITRMWTENARARYDMDKTWNNRKDYRQQ